MALGDRAEPLRRDAHPSAADGVLVERLAHGTLLERMCRERRQSPSKAFSTCSQNSRSFERHRLLAW
jgi:hypothetical protein